MSSLFLFVSLIVGICGIISIIIGWLSKDSSIRKLGGILLTICGALCALAAYIQSKTTEYTMQKMVGEEDQSVWIFLAIGIVLVIIGAAIMFTSKHRVIINTDRQLSYGSSSVSSVNHREENDAYRFCGQCGEKNLTTDIFCTKCGNRS
ncbi:zinc ribbon domain-containing protein [Paenibacillus sp.]|uniref:zinc ribbon domain-containing protein n=1 Tax=Paenibacillus sp. TaxID=58172 RepID=UPI0028354642|nr:zinc ribbon domain-containing protein [Paenibacillus sp.]MDR0268003.1 zinc ribbon domain-containing protein [Paenibacillus sp.]